MTPHARLEGFCEGIGAMTEPRPLTTGEWREFAGQVKTDNERLVRVAWELQKKLTEAEDALAKLRVDAETEVARLERYVSRLHLQRLLACFAGLIGGGITALLVVWVLVAP